MTFSKTKLATSFFESLPGCHRGRLFHLEESDHHYGNGNGQLAEYKQSKKNKKNTKVQSTVEREMLSGQIEHYANTTLCWHTKARKPCPKLNNKKPTNIRSKNGRLFQSPRTRRRYYRLYRLYLSFVINRVPRVRGSFFIEFGVLLGGSYFTTDSVFLEPIFGVGQENLGLSIFVRYSVRVIILLIIDHF